MRLVVRALIRRRPGATDVINGDTAAPRHGPRDAEVLQSGRRLDGHSRPRRHGPDTPQEPARAPRYVPYAR